VKRRWRAVEQTHTSLSALPPPASTVTLREPPRALNTTPARVLLGAHPRCPPLASRAARRRLLPGQIGRRPSCWAGERAYITRAKTLALLRQVQSVSRERRSCGPGPARPSLTGTSL
jgi:hypothetical protein